MFLFAKKNIAKIGLGSRKRRSLSGLAESYLVYQKSLPGFGETTDIIQLNMIDIAVANEILSGRVRRQEKAEKVLADQIKKCQKNGLSEWRIRLIIGFFYQGGTEWPD